VSQIKSGNDNDNEGESCDLGSHLAMYRTIRLMDERTRVWVTVSSLLAG